MSHRMFALSGGDWFLGLSTVFLGLATAYMAWQTRNVARRTEDEVSAVRRQSEASEKQVETATSALQASTRPWFTTFNRERHPVVHFEPDLGRDAFKLRIHVRNVGQGLGLIRPRRSILVGHESATSGPAERREGRAAQPVVPSNGDTQLEFVVDRLAGGVEKFLGRADGLGTMSVDFEYTDAVGGQATAVRIHLANVSSGGYDFRPHRLEYRTPRQEEPDVVVELSTP